MPYHFTVCANCSTKYRAKDIKVRWVGWYKGYRVYEHYSLCPNCNHKLSSYDSPAIDKQFRKEWILQIDLRTNRKDKEKYEKLLNELDKAKAESNRIIEEIKRSIN